MAEERCRWFEDEWTEKNGQSKWPKHDTKCPYSERYLVPGTGRCIFHLSKENEIKAERFEIALIKVLSDEPFDWSDEDDEDKVKYVDLFGFIFPDEFPLYVVLAQHPPQLPLCLVGAQFQRANLYGAHLQGANLNKAQLQGADLRGALLQGADLRKAQLYGANLSKANLQSANLEGAHLQGVDLSDAHLQGAYLARAHLQSTYLREVHLQGANLEEGDIQGADLKTAQLQGAELYGAHLQGADLGGSQLQGADLSKTHLQGANLREAQLQGAELREALLQGADLSKAQLQGANLKWALLQGVKLRGAQLQGADLRWAQLQGANLTLAQLQGANLSEAQLQGANLFHAQLCTDPHYRPGEEWDEWIKDSENNEQVKDRLLWGKERLTGGLNAAILANADLGAGQCRGENRIELTSTEDEYRERTYQNMTKHVSSRGIVTPVYDKNKNKIEAVELELTPAVLKDTDLRGVDLSGLTIAGTDFTEARLDGTLLRGTKFGVKKQGRYDSRWHGKSRWLYASEIGKSRIELLKCYRRLKPKWLRFLLKPFIKLYVKATLIRVELPIFNGANIEAADWADNRRAQRDFVYAEYIRQFKERHPIVSFVWWLFADYGRSILRWAIVSAFIAAFFGCAYLWILGPGQFVCDPQAQLSEGWRCFYYSIVTFTTLGLGDVVPKTDAASIWAAVEVILGYVMLGGLISIFAVKVARRD